MVWILALGGLPFPPFLPENILSQNIKCSKILAEVMPILVCGNRRSANVLTGTSKGQCLVQPVTLARPVVLGSRKVEVMEALLCK